MTAPHRIWAGPDAVLGWNTSRQNSSRGLKWTGLPYTSSPIPEAPSASPEVQALVDAAVKAERDQSLLLEEFRQTVAKGPMLGEDMRHWIERQMRSAAAIGVIAAAIRAGEGAT